MFWIPTVGKRMNLWHVSPAKEHTCHYSSRAREDERARMGDRGTLRVVREDRQGTGSREARAQTRTEGTFPVGTLKSSPEAQTLVLIRLMWLVDLQL